MQELKKLNKIVLLVEENDDVYTAGRPSLFEEINNLKTELIMEYMETHDERTPIHRAFCIQRE